MKKCKYCGTQATDDVLQCNSCGANEFITICVNCRKEKDFSSHFDISSYWRWDHW